MGIMKRTVAFLLLLVDELTGQPVREPLFDVRAWDGRKPVRKEDGHYVFWENGVDSLKLSIESAFFRKRDVRIDMEQVRRKRFPEIRVYLEPGPAYPLPSGIRMKDARSQEPFKLVLSVWEETRGLTALAKDCDAGQDVICLKTFADIQMEGRYMAARRKAPCGEPKLTGPEYGKDGTEIYFRLWDTIDGRLGLYALEEPLPSQLTAKGTELYLVYEAMADERGDYRIPVLYGEEGKEEW